MNPIRTMIVDDEALARQWMRRLLEQEQDLEVVGECGDPVQAIQEIEEKRPELLFVDINMPDMDGFDVVQAIQVDPAPVCIFATAYDQHALRAFDAHAVDYVLKPFDRERVRRAVERAKAAIRSRSGAAQNQNMQQYLQSGQAARGHLQRIAIRSSGRVIFLRIADVDWIEAADNYVALHVGKDCHLLRSTLSGLEPRLSPERFVRIHRSTIINLERLTGLETSRSGDLTVVLEDGTRLSVSRTYRERLHEFTSGVQ